MQNKINDGREEDRIWHRLNCNYMLHLSGNMVFRSVFTRDPGEQYIILIYIYEGEQANIHTTAVVVIALSSSDLAQSFLSNLPAPNLALQIRKHIMSMLYQEAVKQPTITSKQMAQIRRRGHCAAEGSIGLKFYHSLLKMVRLSLSTAIVALKCVFPCRKRNLKALHCFMTNCCSGC